MPTIYLAMLIPLIVTGIFYYFKRHEFAWWEFFVPFFVTLIAVLISKVAIEQSSVSFKEYWGSTITSVYEQEPYNYWKSETCSRQVACGTDSKGNTTYCTEYYDCSHQEDVGPSWGGITNLGEGIDLSEAQYEEISKQFQTKRIIADSNMNYDSGDRCVSSDGTKFQGKSVGNVSYKYQTSWNGSDDTRKPYVSQHRYVNKIKATDLSIFNLAMVNDKTADSLGLFKYPKWEGDGLNYTTILGGNVTKQTQEKFKRLNGKFGVSNQLRLWILVFENKPMTIAQYQENYWVKGNMNELVVCIGKKDNEIQWVHTFSWALSGELTAEVKNKVLDLYTYKDSIVKRQAPPALPTNGKLAKKILGKTADKLPKVLPLPKQLAQQINNDTIVKVRSKVAVLNEQTWDDYYNYLNSNLNKFQRRDFKEYDYLTVEPSTGWVIFVYILALVISVGMCLWVTNNSINEDNPTGNGNGNYYRNNY